MKQFIENNWFKISLLIIIIGTIGLAFFGYNRKPAEVIKEDKTKDNNPSNVTFNKTSKEYAIMGSEVWSAFSCSSWAEVIDKNDEAERLFLYGYGRGKEFIGALYAKKILEGDLSSEVPIGLLMVANGPSEEFALGKVYSSALDNAMDDVYETDNDFNSDELRKSVAQDKFLKANCQLLGR